MFYAAHGSVRSWLFNESTMTRDRYNGICRRWEWLLLPGLLLGLLQLQAAVGYAQRPEKSRLSKLQQEQKQLASRFSESPPRQRWPGAASSGCTRSRTLE